LDREDAKERRKREEELLVFPFALVFSLFAPSRLLFVPVW
jgi:hypothetical protein